MFVPEPHRIEFSVDGKNPEYVIRRVINPIDDALPSLTFVDTLLSGVVAVGTGQSDRRRERSAVGEALELDLIHFLTADLVGLYIPQSDFVDPAQFPVNRWYDGSKIEWVRASDSKGNSCWLHRPTRNSSHPRLREHTSNGVAIHDTLQKSISSAFNEVLERHFLSLLLSSKEVGCSKISEYKHTNFERILASRGFTSQFYGSNIGDRWFTLCILQNETLSFVSDLGISIGCKVSKDLNFARLGSLCEALQVFEAAYLDKENLRTITEHQKTLLRGDYSLALREYLLGKPSQSDSGLQSIGLGATFFRSYSVDQFFYTETFIKGAKHLRNDHFAIGNGVLLPWPL